jgi:hypothetical protein
MTQNHQIDKEITPAGLIISSGGGRRKAASNQNVLTPGLEG